MTDTIRVLATQLSALRMSVAVKRTRRTEMTTLALRFHPISMQKYEINGFYHKIIYLNINTHIKPYWIS